MSFHHWQALEPLTALLSNGAKGWGGITALCLILRSLCWPTTAISQETPLTCLNGSENGLSALMDLGIQNSSEMAAIEELIDGQIDAQLQQVEVLEAADRTSSRSIPSILSQWRQTENLATQKEEKAIEQFQVHRELAQLASANGEEEVLVIAGRDTGFGSSDALPPEDGRFFSINTSFASYRRGADIEVCASSNETRLIIERQPRSPASGRGYTTET